MNSNIKFLERDARLHYDSKSEILTLNSESSSRKTISSIFGIFLGSIIIVFFSIHTSSTLFSLLWILLGMYFISYFLRNLIITRSYTFNKKQMSYQMNKFNRLTRKNETIKGSFNEFSYLSVYNRDSLFSIHLNNKNNTSFNLFGLWFIQPIKKSSGDITDSILFFSDFFKIGFKYYHPFTYLNNEENFPLLKNSKWNLNKK